MKHTIKTITWHWNEGLDYGLNGKEMTLEQANNYLHRVARDMRPGGGYNKVKFTATFEDGETYEGRFDVHHIDDQQETSTRALSFLDHIIDYIKFYFGDSKPSHMTTQDYEQLVKSYNGTETEKIEWYERLGLVENSETKYKTRMLQDTESRIQQIMEDISNLDGVESVSESLGKCLESIDHITAHA